mgnify:CR=1 FL=1|tara:strand:- start:273 stop:752 length:480 start_codon:yes stop_codon:yes gene_type:complete
MENQLIPYQETSIGSDINQNDISLLQSGAIIIRNKDSEIKVMNDNIKELRENIKLLKEERKKAEMNLIPIMNKCDCDTLNVTNGSIKYVEKVQKAPLNKKNLEKILISFFTDENNFNNLLNITYDNNIDLAEKRTKYILKYIEEKGQKKKTIYLKGIFN